ncbi:MAG: polyprenyl synthetase family protein [Planctomycetaceae bacterium]|nr:polyprenyl synthetase family protein [Planctomycetaceae bacterium]
MPPDDSEGGFDLFLSYFAEILLDSAKQWIKLGLAETGDIGLGHLEVLPMRQVQGLSLGEILADPSVGTPNEPVLAGPRKALGELDGEVQRLKAAVVAAVDQRLERAFAEHPQTEVGRVAQYAVRGGHRWRAMIAVAAGSIFDDRALETALPIACAVELAHAASLILDDLPSMDDAQLRRGRPCAHLVFPRWAVDLAPTLLLMLGYELILTSPCVSNRRRAAAALDLTQAGLRTVCGQELDLDAEKGPVDPDRLWRCYRLKSGALFATAAKAGALVCGGGDDEAEDLQCCGTYLGMAYQCADDVADVVGHADQMGKAVGMDVSKTTAVTILGLTGAEQLVRRFKAEAFRALERFGERANSLRRIIGDVNSIAT